MRAFFGELAVLAEREHLEAAAVGEDRAFPAVELMEAARAPENLGAGAQLELICLVSSRNS